MSGRYICIEGNIGSGKTTLAKMLSRSWDSRLLLEEFEENPFLARFYEEPEKYAFPLEMSFLADRYRQLKETLSTDLFKPNITADYTPFKSLVFASMNLPEREFKLYREFFNIVYQQLRKPDLTIYLQRPTDQLLRNIQQRGRVFENGISANYLIRIHESYLNYFRQSKELKVMTIDARDLDFIHNPDDFNYLKKEIEQRVQL